MSTAIVEQFWRDLYARDYDKVGSYFPDDGEYTDVCSPADDVARGPKQVAARLRLGFEPLASISHDVRLMIADGNVVVTEHLEHWEWETGERADLPFVSVMEFRGDQIVRWWDYWDMSTLMNAAPAAWVEHIMQGYQ
jgi:limonene-1,2-epoxide hydrolase